MKFLDTAKIFVQSGAGGVGAVSFRREKFVEFGGPDGGNGGRGGDVIVRAVAGLNTLIDFRYRQHYKAKRGKGGSGSNCTGPAADNVVINVPLGTQILLEDGETLLYDLDTLGQEVTLAHGGDGGRGNQSFKTATNRAPRRSEPGFPGEEFRVWLHLKLLADVGLVGLPNAGKSSLLNSMTMATAKVGNYPFTTLYPQLGVAHCGDVHLVMADIPGLIEGASDGVGLGTRFLGHVERCQSIIHMIDVTSDDIVRDYHIIREEMRAYGQELVNKPQVIALNKCDTIEQPEIDEAKNIMQVLDVGEVFCISALLQTGLKPLLYKIVGNHNATPSSEAHQPWQP